MSTTNETLPLEGEVLPAELKQEAAQAVEAVDTANDMLAIKVVTDVDAEQAARVLSAASSQSSKIEEIRLAIVRRFEAAKKGVIGDLGLEQRQSMLQRGIAHLKSELLTFRRRKEQEHAAAIAAEQERARKEQAKLLERAQRAEAKGWTEKAAELEQRAADALPAPVAPATPKLGGVAFREQWLFKVENPELVPNEYKTIDEKKIGGVVRALKAAANIPGVKIWRENVAASRGARS